MHAEHLSWEKNHSLILIKSSLRFVIFIQTFLIDDKLVDNDIEIQ